MQAVTCREDVTIGDDLGTTRTTISRGERLMAMPKMANALHIFWWWSGWSSDSAGRAIKAQRRSTTVLRKDDEV